MNVLLLNGSPHPNGCTAAALQEMIGIFQEENVGTELIQVGRADIRGCVACGSCSFICPAKRLTSKPPDVLMKRA